MIKELINRIINVSGQPLARYSFQRKRKSIEVQHEGIPASMQIRRFIHILLLFSTLLHSLLYATISAELSSVCRRISPKKYSEFSGRIWFMALCFCVDFQQRLKFGQIFFFIKSGREHVLRHDGHVFSSRKTPAHKQGALQDAPEAAVLTTVPYVQLLYSNLQVKGIN